MKLRVMVMALALCACGQAEQESSAPQIPDAPDPASLQVEIGRYSVMLDAVETLTDARPGAGPEDVQSPQALARGLRQVVWQYNLERSQLCERGLFADVACGPVYEPVWISEPADAAPTLEEIQARSSAVGEEVTRFWDAVCEDARARGGEDGAVCVVE